METIYCAKASTMLPLDTKVTMWTEWQSAEDQPANPAGDE